MIIGSSSNTSFESQNNHFKVSINNAKDSRKFPV